MSEHAAWNKIEEWQSKYVLTLMGEPSRGWLSLYLPSQYQGQRGDYYEVTTTAAIDLRLVDLVTQMQARLAE